MMMIMMLVMTIEKNNKKMGKKKVIEEENPLLLEFKVSKGHEVISLRLFKTFYNWIYTKKSTNLIQNDGKWFENHQNKPLGVTELSKILKRKPVTELGIQVEEPIYKDSSDSEELEPEEVEVASFLASKKRKLDGSSIEQDRKRQREFNDIKMKEYFKHEVMKTDPEDTEYYVNWYRSYVESPIYSILRNPLNLGNKLLLAAFSENFRLKIPSTTNKINEAANGINKLLEMLRMSMIEASSHNARSKKAQYYSHLWIIHEVLRISSEKLPGLLENERKGKNTISRFDVGIYYLTGRGVAVLWSIRASPKGSTHIEIEENQWIWLSWDNLLKKFESPNENFVIFSSDLHHTPWSVSLSHSRIMKSKDETRLHISPTAPQCKPLPGIRIKLLEAYMSIIRDCGELMSAYVFETFQWILCLNSVKDYINELSLVFQVRPSLMLCIPLKFKYSMVHVALSLDREFSQGIPSSAIVSIQKSLVMKSEVKMFAVISYWLERDPATYNPIDLIPLFMDMRISWSLCPTRYIIDKSRIGIAVILSFLNRPMPFVFDFDTDLIGKFMRTPKGIKIAMVTKIMCAIQLFYLLKSASNCAPVLQSARNPKILNWSCFDLSEKASFWLLRLFSVLNGEISSFLFCVNYIGIPEEYTDLCFYLKERMGREVNSWHIAFSRHFVSQQIGITTQITSIYPLKRNTTTPRFFNGTFITDAEATFRAPFFIS